MIGHVNYTILYYTILYYTILYCTVLYCTIICYSILHYRIPRRGHEGSLRAGPAGRVLQVGSAVEALANRANYILLIEIHLKCSSRPTIFYFYFNIKQGVSNTLLQNKTRMYSFCFLVFTFISMYNFIIFVFFLPF